MFDSVGALEMDLRRFVADGYRVQQPFQFSSSDVGIALIRLASGKTVEEMPSSADPNGLPPIDLRAAASRFVADIMLGAGADHFTTLGVVRDTDAGTMRENFRRMMALVHPDARPVGFPSDAASRVNRAYAVVADDVTRATYAATLSVPEPSAMVVRSAANTSRAAGSPKVQRHSGGVGERLRGLAQVLRARHVLLWLAGLLLIPLGLGLTSLLPREAPARLVEARPKLNLSADLGGVSQSSPTPASGPSSQTPVTSATDAAAESVATAAPVTTSSTGKVRPERTAPPREPQGAPAVAMTSQLSARSVGLASRTAPSQSLAPAAGYSATTAAAGEPAAQTARSTGPEPAASAGARQADAHAAPASPAISGAISTASVRPAPSERGDTPPKTRTSDAEDILVRFTNAYESGSIGGFGQLFSSTMVGRRQMLNDYERVFSATRQRSIKFNQLKHAAAGDRVATSGYATVTTTDQDNRVVTQRVFLEFEISRERGEARIERLSNYVIN